MRKKMIATMFVLTFALTGVAMAAPKKAAKQAAAPKTVASTAQALAGLSPRAAATLSRMNPNAIATLSKMDARTIETLANMDPATLEALTRLGANGSLTAIDKNPAAIRTFNSLAASNKTAAASTAKRR